MTIDETIDAACSLFGIKKQVITSGGRNKDRRITDAREWIVRHQPDASHRSLAKALGYFDHSSVLIMRRRLKNKSHSHAIHTLSGPYFVH